MILGIDLGTGSLKAVAVTDDGTIAAAGEADYDVQSPELGWSETDPEAWWQALVTAVRALPGDVRRQIAAIGLSGQMHSLVLSTSAGEPVRPAILWSDTRSKSVVADYRSLAAAQRKRLANPIVAGMTGPSLLWLARHEPEAVESARWALQPKDWIRLRMTGVAATDPSDASATLLYDIPADAWAEDVLHSLGLPPGILPPIRASDARAGVLLKAPADALGLTPGTPVAVGAGDTPAAALGTGLVDDGEAQLSLGTGAQIVVVGSSCTPRADPTVHCFRSALPEQHYTMAAMQNAGLALNWVRTVLDFTWEQIYASFEPERIRRDLVFLPYLSGERTPLMDSTARAAWLGMSLHHTREDLAGAALAGVAMSILDGFEAILATGTEIERLRVTGGGSRVPHYMQFLCDLLGVPFEIAETPRASALGAARLAGRMVGREPSAAQSIQRAAGARVKPRAFGDDVKALLEAFRRMRDLLFRQEG